MQHPIRLNIASSSFSTGVQYMLLATLFFSVMHMLVKELSGFHVFEIIFFRSVISALFCMTHLYRQQVSFIGKKQKYLIIRALIGIIPMTLFFITLQRMPMGASLTLKYLSPVFTAIFAVILLKEKVRPIQWFFILIAFIGVIMMKGFDPRIDTLNLILGITGAVFGGLVYVVIRKIGTSEHPMVIINYYMGLATILAGIGMIPFWENPDGKEWLYLIGMGIFGYIGQVYMTKSLQLELASKVTPLKYMEVIYALIIGWIWFGESYAFLSFLGIVLVLISMVLNVVVKYKS